MEDKGLVLLVEDNKELNTANSRALKLRGYTVLTAEDIAEARAQFLLQMPDVILLDVMLPDGDGFSFCKEIRQKTTAHILFLTAKTEHKDTLRGLANGGDDYITKPFHPEELLARVDAAMRRRQIDGAPSSLKQRLVRGTLMLDLVAAQAFLQGVDLVLTAKEFALLVLLVQNEGKALRAQQLYEKIWNAPLIENKNSVRTAISKLRQKIEPSGYYIASRRDEGYSFMKKPAVDGELELKD